jgi:hypothetical protein
VPTALTAINSARRLVAAATGSVPQPARWSTCRSGGRARASKTPVGGRAAKDSEGQYVERLVDEAVRVQRRQQEGAPRAGRRSLDVER